MRDISWMHKDVPLDGYVYEASEPEYGNVAVELDVEAFKNSFHQ
jgi:hypothetical protein